MKTPINNVPISNEAEQSVIGGLILDNNKFDEVSELIQAEDFSVTAHQVLYLHISKLINSNTPCDLVTLNNSLEAVGYSEQTGGFAYIAEICKNTPSVANILAYANIIAQHSKSRKVIALGSNMINKAREKNSDINHVIKMCEDELYRIEQKNAVDTTVDITESVTTLLTNIENRANLKLTGTSSGYDVLDNYTCGFQSSDLIILAARPSMGKTALGLDFCLNALKKHNSPVHIYSLEMPKNQILERCLSTLGNVPLQKIRTGKLTDEDWSGLSKATKLLCTDYQDKLILDDTASLTPTLLRTRVRRNVRKFGKPSLIMIDYLQLMRSVGKENRNQEIADISRSLKALAKELDVPILALSQLNRGLENRADKRPNNGDLRDSGSLEQDADVILFIYRDEIYHEDTLQKDVAEIILGKQRNGPIGTVKLKFNSKFTRFETFNGNGGSYDFG